MEYELPWWVIEHRVWISIDQAIITVEKHLFRISLKGMLVKSLNILFLTNLLSR